jgi:hypothetical protein
MYQNLHNLVERAVVQQAEVDQRQHTGIESHGTHMSSSWSKGAQAYQSTPMRIHIKHIIRGIHDA